MGCTDEKSVSPTKKIHKNSNQNNEKLNHSKDDDIKEISNQIDSNKELNTIKLELEEQNDSKKKNNKSKDNNNKDVDEEEEKEEENIWRKRDRT